MRFWVPWTLLLAVAGGEHPPAADFVAAGTVTVLSLSGSSTAIVQTTTFRLTRVGPNWSWTQDYTNSQARVHIAFVDGRAYMVTWDWGRTMCGGLAMDRPGDLVDSLPVFDRILFTTFQTSDRPPLGSPDTAVGFLDPRHPAVRCYDSEVVWSGEAPGFPERIRYRLNPERIRRVPDEDINYFFRSGLQNRALFRQFQKSQEGGAEYVVRSWTNWARARFPLEATLRHMHQDLVTRGTVMDMALVVRITDLSAPESGSLVPPLLPGSDVQQVFEKGCYLYKSPDGSFLSPAQAKASGRVLTPAPPPPAAMRFVAWLWPVRGRILAGLLILLVLAAVGSLMAWFLARRR